MGDHKRRFPKIGDRVHGPGNLVHVVIEADWVYVRRCKEFKWLTACGIWDKATRHEFQKHQRGANDRFTTCLECLAVDIPHKGIRPPSKRKKF